MPDEDMPPQPITMELPKPSSTDISFQRLETVFARLDRKFDTLVEEVRSLALRVGNVEQRQGATEDRMSRTSTGVKQLATMTSEHDLEQQAKIAEVINWRIQMDKKVDALDTKTDAQTKVLEQLLKLTEKPMVKLVAGAVGTAFLSWLATKGLR